MQNKLKGINSRQSNTEEDEIKINSIWTEKEKWGLKIMRTLTGSLRQQPAYHHSHYRGPRRRREREAGQKCVWRNYGLPEPEEGNRNPGTGSTEGTNPTLKKC